MLFWDHKRVYWWIYEVSVVVLKIWSISPVVHQRQKNSQKAILHIWKLETLRLTIGIAIHIWTFLNEYWCTSLLRCKTGSLVMFVVRMDESNRLAWDLEGRDFRPSDVLTRTRCHRWVSISTTYHRNLCSISHGATLTFFGKSLRHSLASGYAIVEWQWRNRWGDQPENENKVQR
jgi:hypothetical protein